MVECGSATVLRHEWLYRFVLRYLDKKPTEHVLKTTLNLHKRNIIDGNLTKEHKRQLTDRVLERG